MKLQGKRVVILISHEFEDVEASYPMLRLSEEGAWVTYATRDLDFHPRPAFPGKPITGRFGTTIPPFVNQEGKRFDVRPLEELSPADYDAVVIPGGFSPDYLRIDQVTLAFVRQAHELGKIIAAICHGPWVMISASIVKGRKATGWLATLDDLRNAGAILVDEAAVVDGNLITSRNPDDLPEFCLAIIEALS